MKKYFAVLLLAVCIACPIQVSAATGNMKVQLPVDAAMAVSCAKVGTMKNGVFVLEKEYKNSHVDLNQLKTAKELEEAADILYKWENSASVFRLDEKGSVVIPELEEGVYLIHGYGNAQKEILPTLVFLPTWYEEEEEYLYDITVFPKWQEKVIPNTGDDSQEWLYVGALVTMSAVILSIMKNKMNKNMEGKL